MSFEQIRCSTSKSFVPESISTLQGSRFCAPEGSTLYKAFVTLYQKSAIPLGIRLYSKIDKRIKQYFQQNDKKEGGHGQFE